MDNSIAVRRLTVDDVDAFHALRLHAVQQHPRAYGLTYAEESNCQRQCFVHLVTADVVLGAFADDALVGYTILSGGSLIKLRHKAEVWGAYMKPEYRSMLLAKRMGQQLFEIAQSLGVRYCQSSVFASNVAAYRMYKVLGFVEVYREKDGVGHEDGSFEDIIHLVKYL
jgi:ribosomal protein S18 acetylase RimI-like enzyme